MIRQSPPAPSTSGTRDAALDLGEPPQPGGLGLEEALRRVGQRLHQRGLPAGQPQPRGRGDVAAGHRRGRDHGRAEELLGTPGDQRLASHQAGPRPPGRSVALDRRLQGRHDPVARALDHCQHLLEPVVPTVVRVRDGATRIHRIEVAEHADSLGASADVGQVGLVHHEHEVVRLGPGRVVLPGAVPARVVAGGGQRGRGARVHRVADVPAARAGRGDLDAVGEAGVGEPALEHDVGHGRAADVAEADEGDPVGTPGARRGTAGISRGNGIATRTSPSRRS